MPDYKLLRTWVTFEGSTKEETFGYLTPEGQDQARTLLDTADKGRRTQTGFAYSFHFRFYPHEFADGKVPNKIEDLAALAEAKLLAEYVFRPDKVLDKFSDIVPGQYIDQGKVKA